MKTTKALIITAITSSLFYQLPLFSQVSEEAVKANWKQHCAKCHGKEGTGETKMGKKLKVKDYTDPAVQAEFKDKNMMKAMLEGVRSKSGKLTMKPLKEKLSEDEMRDLITFIRAMEKQP
jgi:cytochrome c553